MSSRDPLAPSSPRSAGGVLLVGTTGNGSMDRYGQQLASRIGAPTFELPLERTSAGHFNVGLLSAASLRGAAGDRAVLRRLRHALDQGSVDREDGRIPHFAHHHLARYGPALRRPFLVTAHDLIRYSDMAVGDPTGAGVLINQPNRRDRRYLRRDYAGMRAASAVIAVSETTRRDLLDRLGLRPDRVFVVHEGIDHELFQPVRRRLVDGPYLLFVGSEHPRKNLVVLLRAFARLKTERRWQRLRLVKVGAAGSGEAPFREPTLAALRALGLADQVMFTEEVPDADLPAYYSGAECLVLPSRAEGFGFPPLEAMACGCPVIVSTAGALPEIVGDAGLQVPPNDVEGLHRALRTLLGCATLRRTLRDRGLRRAQEFSWEHAARQTERVYENALCGAPGGRRTLRLSCRPPQPWVGPPSSSS